MRQSWMVRDSNFKSQLTSSVTLGRRCTSQPSVLEPQNAVVIIASGLSEVRDAPLSRIVKVEGG